VSADDTSNPEGVGGSGGPGGPGRPQGRLTSLERVEALALADELLVQRVPDARILKALRERYSLSVKGARQLFDLAVRGMQEVVAAGVGRRRAQAIRTAERIVERALREGKLGTAIQAHRQLCEIEGHFRPVRIEIDRGSAESEEDREFAGRSAAELEHYATSGRWPDEEARSAVAAAASRSNGKPEFPLH